MNKKIAIIITLMITSTTALIGCNSTVKVDSESVPDTVFEVSSSEDDNDKTEITDSSVEDSSAANSKTDDKIIQNNTNSQTSSTKVNTKNTSSATSSVKTTESATTKATSGKVTTFTAQAGYTLTFPANWDGKYIVEEKPDKLIVRYKCSKDTISENAYLFLIEKYDPNEKYYELDTVGNIRTFNVGDTKYIIGGPTGLCLGEESKDFEEYIEIDRQRADVVNSLKVIK